MPPEFYTKLSGLVVQAASLEACSAAALVKAAEIEAMITQRAAAFTASKKKTTQSTDTSALGYAIGAMKKLRKPLQ